MAAASILQVDNLTLRRGKRQILEGLSFELVAGKKRTILGGNATGKSSLAQALCGLLPVFKGTILVHGRVGYAHQEPRMPGRLQPRAWLAQMAALGGARGRDATYSADATLAAFGLQKEAKRPIGDLSRGLRQRLHLARAWLAEPPLLVLDEPHTALDPEGLALVQDLLEQTSAAVLLLTPPGTPFAQLFDPLFSLGGVPCSV